MNKNTHITGQKIYQNTFKIAKLYLPENDLEPEDILTFSDLDELFRILFEGISRNEIEFEIFSKNGEVFAKFTEFDSNFGENPEPLKDYGEFLHKIQTLVIKYLEEKRK